MAIVYDKPGVTRDALEGTAFIGGLEFQLTDTAGLDDAGDLQGEGMHVEKVGSIIAASGIGRWPAHLLTTALSRTEQVIKDADAVLFVVDAKHGVTPVDVHFARWVNKHNRPAVLLANKSEGDISPISAHDIRNMGMGEPLYCSVTQNEGISQLVTLLYPLAAYFEDPEVFGSPAAPEGKFPRILILGRCEFRQFFNRGFQSIFHFDRQLIEHLLDAIEKLLHIVVGDSADFQDGQLERLDRGLELDPLRLGFR